MKQTRQELEGLNYLLHGATVLGLELDTSNQVATISLQVTTLPKTGQQIVRSYLSLRSVSALVVTMQTAEGDSPHGRMAPVGRDELAKLASDRHPLTGFDFIDSDRDSEPRGSLLFEWFEPGVPSHHILSIYFGLVSEEGEEALLFFRMYFDSARLTYPDGRDIPIDVFAPAQDKLGRAMEVGPDRGELSAIRVLPDPVPPGSIDGEPLALLFVNPEHLVSGWAVGEARWDGRHLRWLSPDDVLYDLPDAAAKAIRPRVPEMGMGAVRLDGFSHFVLLPGPAEFGVATKEWVDKTLKPSRRWWPHRGGRR